MEASQRPIPPPHDDDDEDVHWALSTATALWERGEREEALRWLRRAAEQASDANADLRALELFKAAAEVAQTIATSDAAPQAASAPPPPERGGASASSPPRAPSVRAPAGSAPPSPSSARPPPRDPGALRPAMGLGRSSHPVAPGWGGAPVPAAGRGAPSAPPVAATRAAGSASGLPAHPTASPRASDLPGGGPSTAAAHGRAGMARGGALAGFGASSHERMSSTTAVTEEVPVVKLTPADASQERGQGVSAAALRGASAEQHLFEGEPAADQRETVPTDIAVAFLRQPTTPVGASSEETERRERDWSDDSDDEGTTRRTLSGQVQRALQAHRTEDPDEETPLLERAGNREGSASRAVAAPADGPMGTALDERAGWAEAEPPFDGAWKAPPPRLPAAQIEPLPALRMAVIGISSAGELRLVPVDGRNAPPRGAALGIFVPLSPEDGETIARLLQLRG